MKLQCSTQINIHIRLQASCFRPLTPKYFQLLILSTHKLFEHTTPMIILFWLQVVFLSTNDPKICSTQANTKRNRDCKLLIWIHNIRFQSFTFNTIVPTFDSNLEHSTPLWFLVSSNLLVQVPLKFRLEANPFRLKDPWNFWLSSLNHFRLHTLSTTELKSNHSRSATSKVTLQLSFLIFDFTFDSSNLNIVIWLLNNIAFDLWTSIANILGRSNNR